MLGDRQLREILEARILSGEWSRRTGGRFNYPSEYRVAYLAQDPVTAQAEAEQIQAPYVHLPVRGTLERVLDLTRHVCLAVFPDRLTGRSFLEIEDPAGILLERIP